MQYTYRDIFPLLKTVLNSLILIPFRASAIFCFTSSTSAKCFPLRIFFSWRNKKVAWGKIRWIGRGGPGDQAFFWSKTAQYSVQCGQVRLEITHHKMGKKIHWSHIASHSNASWHTDTDGFLEHSPSRGCLYYKGPALQKIILFFGVPPHICLNNRKNTWLLFLPKTPTFLAPGTSFVEDNFSTDREWGQEVELCKQSFAFSPAARPGS